ncbi:MAG TPA: hypothetical protein VNA67_00245 [Pseudonocardiaceae bacterium]|nr:hypothetical protein [Pseudonocardiaceae bacterium]
MELSLDSVITAVGMVDELFIVIAAVMIAIGIMLLSAGAISDFVNRHPTVKMLALAFLLLIGASLVAEGFDARAAQGLHLRPDHVRDPGRGSQPALPGRGHSPAPEKAAPDIDDDPVHLRPAYVKSGAHGVTLPRPERKP